MAAREIVEPNPGQPGKGPTREDEPERAADRREQSGLREQLPKDPAAAGADRVPRRDLLEAPAGPDESEVRHVHRGDEEHEQRRAPQQTQSRPHVAHEVGFERDDDRAVARVEQRRLQAAGALDVRRRQPVDLRLRLLQRGALRQPGDGVMVLAVAGILRLLLGGERARDPDLDLGIEEDEALRRHADDAIRPAVQPEILSDGVLAAAQFAGPVVVADDDDIALPFLRLGLGEEAAARRGRAQHGEEGRRDLLCREALDRAGVAGIQSARTVQGDGLERVRQRRPVHVVRNRRAGALDAGAGETVVGEDESMAFRIRERPEQDRPDDREDCGVGAQADRQGEDHRGGVGAVSTQEPQREDQVLPQRFHRVLRAADEVTEVHRSRSLL